MYSLGASCPSRGPVVSGTPKPEVTWFLEGAPVKRREGMFEVYEEGGCHYLCLLRVRPKDSGSYSCTASNVRGQVSCGWTLLVKREYAPPVILGSLLGGLASVGRFLHCRTVTSYRPHAGCPTRQKHHPHPHANAKVIAPGQVTPHQEFPSESPQNKYAHHPHAQPC